MIRKQMLVWLLIIGITAVLAACGGSAEPETVETTQIVTESQEAAESALEPPLATGSEGLGDEPPPPETGEKVKVTRAVTEPTGGEASAAEIADAARVESEVVAASPLPTSTFSEANPDRAAGEPVAAALTLDQNSRLTAGEVDDNAEWDDYVQYLRSYQGAAVIPVDVSDRRQIWVQDNQGNPVVGREVQILANGAVVASLRTHSDGRVYFFPRAYPTTADEYQVSVAGAANDERLVIPADASQREWFVTLPEGANRDAAVNLDVLFLIDATGSMSDEINQLKDNIQAISARIDALPSQPDVRFGMVTYRDRGDEYVTRVTDFTPDVDDFADVLAQVRADGGGDYPEDLNEALSNAVHEPEWRVNDSVSLIFLVADAPPHLDYGQQNHYAYEMLQAAQRGLKIYPIASSGLDSQGEYIFRQLAQATGGRFIFLTYGAEGPGSTGTETNFEVSDYTVSSLDDLVVKIVEEELAPLNR